MKNKHSDDETPPKVAEKKPEPLPIDPVSVLFTEESDDTEFPGGAVMFAPNIRWFGSFVVDPGLTVTGNGYQIERTGTKVDARDMEALMNIIVSVWCPRNKRHYEIHPVGVTR